MRKKRKRRRHSSVKKHEQENVIYNFTKLQITSSKELKEEQLTNVVNQLEYVIVKYKDEPSYIVAKKIIVQLKEYICSVQYSVETDCFMVAVNEKYFD